MMFWLLQKQLGTTKTRRRYFSIFVALMLSLFVITQIHHATLQHAPLQQEQGDSTTSLPPYSKRPKTKRKTKADLADASKIDLKSNKNEGQKSLVVPSSKIEHQVPLHILELATTPKVQNARIQTQQSATTTSTTTNNDTFMSRRPSLDQLVKDDEITGDVSWLLDFAILGHAKCATTFLSSWFREHPNVQTWDREVCDLNNRKPADLVRKLYQELPEGNEYIRGYKCPGHFSREPLRNIRRYFGNARLIVGLRHPVRWFESYYNFRIRHPRGGVMPPPDRLIGKCVHESQGVCTDRANFHTNLAMFGKTNMTDPVERKLLHLPTRYAATTLSTIPNRVFLYDVGQLYDKDETRVSLFRQDLTSFLGLQKPLTSSTATSNNNSTAASTAGKTSSKTTSKYAHVDICHADYDAIRHELLEIGKRASAWIVKYFMKSDQVVVSSPDFFASILESWKEDPCKSIQPLPAVTD